MSALQRARPGAWVGPRGIVVLIVAAVAAGVLSRSVPWPFAVLGVAAILSFLFAADARAGAGAFVLRRTPPERYALARADRFAYAVENRSSVALRCAIVESPVERLAVDASGAPAFAVAPHTTAAASIGFIPRERGTTALGDTYAWYETAFGLLRHRVRLPGALPIRVMPDLSALAAGDLARRARMLESGSRRLRRRGAGTEFESLREYAAGDAFRDIDWKATARRGRTMVAQYDIERAQQIVVAIDAGRLMSARLNDRRKLDYAISAALAIASAARTSTDRVGVHAFAGTTLATLAPGAGVAHTAALVDVLAGIEPHFEESDYERAAVEIGRRVRKRSLIVAFTDLFDPVASSAVLASLALLVRRHLVVVALMNDAAIDDALAIDPGGLADAYRASVAVTLAGERERAVASLRARGMVVVDVAARDLTPALLDAYVEIKRRARL